MVAYKERDDHSLQSNYVSILSIPINQLTMNELIHLATDWIKTWPDHQRPYYICTVNTDFLVNAIGWTPLTLTNPELYQCLLDADLATADGMPLVWFSVLCGYPLPERVSGIDLIYRLCESLDKMKGSVYLLGGTAEVAQGAADALRKRYPDLLISGTSSPIVDLSDETQRAEIVAAVNASKPDLLLLNLGNPKQELWFYRARSQLKIPLAIGVGGSFSFIGNKIPRAPLWMQKWGLEWLFRLSQEPQRLWKRYTLDIFKFNAIADYVAVVDWLYRLVARLLSNSIRPNGEAHIENSTYTIVLPSNLQEKDQYRWFFSQLQKGMEQKHIILDFTNVTYFDIRYLGLLIHATAQADRRGIHLELQHISKILKFYFYIHHSWELLKKHTTR